MGNAQVNETAKVERPKTPSGRVKKAPGPITTETKHVKFSKDHVHRGVSYRAGDEADILVPEADAIIKMGSAGEAKPNPNRVDVVAQ